MMPAALRSARSHISNVHGFSGIHYDIARCPVGYSSPRRPRRSRCRPMNHPTMNTAPTKAMITPMLTSR
jgi:hypothetical protein